MKLYVGEPSNAIRHEIYRADSLDITNLSHREILVHMALVTLEAAGVPFLGRTFEIVDLKGTRVQGFSL